MGKHALHIRGLWQTGAGCLAQSRCTDTGHFQALLPVVPPSFHVGHGPLFPRYALEHERAQNERR
eukprot:10149173-Lingulodinium_polyedra.AAC.1